MQWSKIQRRRLYDQNDPMELKYVKSKFLYASKKKLTFMKLHIVWSFRNEYERPVTNFVEAVKKAFLRKMAY